MNTLLIAFERIVATISFKTRCHCSASGRTWRRGHVKYAYLDAAAACAQSLTFTADIYIYIYIYIYILYRRRIEHFTRGGEPGEATFESVEWLRYTPSRAGGGP
jgi:hypothetical protein